MNHTQNYNLNQWEASDRVLRTDFNADNAKIDAAIAAAALGNCRVEYGTYVGTGVFGDVDEKATVLRLGYVPKLLFVRAAGDVSGGVGIFMWPSLNGTHFYNSGEHGNQLVVRWTEDGVAWRVPHTNQLGASSQLNELGITYHFIAFS